MRNDYELIVIRTDTLFIAIVTKIESNENYCSEETLEGYALNVLINE